MLQYLAWPDMDIPTDSPSLYKMINSLEKSQRVLVHCSAGVGRTGTFIALADLINLVNSKAQDLNLFQKILELRKDREFMVNMPSFIKYLF